MTFSRPAILALAAQCAPNVAPQTVAAIVATESGGRPLALNINRGQQPPPPRTASEAAATAQRFIAAGYSVDLGLGQINSRNMRRLGLTWANIFDPCTNIAALGRVLTENYETALSGRAPQNALRVALSIYNTGHPSRGFRNGYVAKVVGNAGLSETPTSTNPTAAASISPTFDRPLPIDPELRRPIAPPAWDLFARASFERETASVSATVRRKSVWAE